MEQGTNGFFELIVPNAGPSDAVGVLVTDAVNGLLEVVDVQPQPECEASTGQDVSCTFDIPIGETKTITVEYTAAEFLDPDAGPLFGTQEGDEFRFVFVNGYVLEGSSDTDGAATLILTDPDGNEETLPYNGTKNDMIFDPPGDDPFLMHLSCSDAYTGGWGDSGGPVEGVDVNWQIASYSILRHNQNGFFKACGDVVTPMDVRLGFMSPVMISHYALSGSPLPTSAALLSRTTYGDDHSRTGAFASLKSGGMIASWYQSYVVNPHEDRREEIGIVYRDPAGQWSTIFPLAIDGSAGGGIPQSRQALVQHPADDGIWLFNKRDSYHSMEVVHLSETDSGIVVDWIDPLFINEREHGTESLEAEFPAIVAIADPIRKVIILAFGDNGYYMTNCEGNCFQKVTHATVLTITANGTQRFETYSPFTIERTTRFGMALAGTKLWFVYKPLQLLSKISPSLEAISYDIATGLWSPSASLGEPFWASRELSAVFGTDPLVFAHLMVDQKIHYFSIEND